MRAAFQSPYSVNWGAPINWQAHLNRGLLSWWMVAPALNGGTTFRDLCKRNDGTLTSMDPPTDWVYAGRRGGFGCLDFDGSNDYVNLGAASGLYFLPLVGSACTISFWVNVRPSATGHLFSMWDLAGGVNQKVFIFDLTGQAVRNYWSTNGTADGTTITSTTNSTNTWRHVCLTYDGTRRLYINGVEEGTAVTASINTSATTNRLAMGAVIGRAADTPVGFANVQLDSFRIYNRVVNPLRLYREEQSFYPTTLRRWAKRRVFVPAAPVGGAVGIGLTRSLRLERVRLVG